MNQLELAEKIAREAHAGQFRKDGVTPYIRHVESVVSRVDTDEEKCVAWLHDVIEDSDLNTVKLRNLGVEVSISDCVGMLTRRSETYAEFIDAIHCENCQTCTKVKIADILSNLSDRPTEKQIVKYAKALLVLTK